MSQPAVAIDVQKTAWVATGSDLLRLLADAVADLPEDPQLSVRRRRPAPD
jgi:hypothetical protein